MMVYADSGYDSIDDMEGYLKGVREEVSNRIMIAKKEISNG